MQVEDKVIVVTGAAHGIGRALCERFQKQGARCVVVADIDEEAAREVAAAIDGHAIRCDVSSERDIFHLVEQTEAIAGGIDLFCSNAGVFYPDAISGRASSTPDHLWQRAWQINVMAHVYAARACVPGMLARGGGHFLNTISAAGLLTQVDAAVYATTKHAAVGFAESLAITHRDQGIGVSMLCPQGVDTEMLRHTGERGHPILAREGILTPEQVAEIALDGLMKDAFLILTHPRVATYMQNKAADYDRWIVQLAKLRRSA